jgi:hypothetical protein
MCQKIVINNGEKEIETPREFNEHFNMTIELFSDEGIHQSFLDCCLCSVDVEDILKKENISFTEELGDIYINEKK